MGGILIRVRGTGLRSLATVSCLLSILDRLEGPHDVRMEVSWDKISNGIGVNLKRGTAPVTARIDQRSTGHLRYGWMLRKGAICAGYLAESPFKGHFASGRSSRATVKPSASVRIIRNR